MASSAGASNILLSFFRLFERAHSLSDVVRDVSGTDQAIDRMIVQAMNGLIHTSQKHDDFFTTGAPRCQK